MTTLDVLNAVSFCERVLSFSCVKLVVSDIHVRLKPEEIRKLVSNRGLDSLEEGEEDEEYVF